MKIVISSDLYWPTFNGVSTASRSLAIGLAERGHEVLVLAPSQDGTHYIQKDGNYKIVRLKSIPFPFYHNQTETLPSKNRRINMPRVYLNGFKLSLNPYREIQVALDKFQPDIIHNQQYLMIGRSVLRYAKKNAVPIIITNHVLPENLTDNLRLIAPFSKTINSVMKNVGANFMKDFDYATMPTQSAIDMLAHDVKKLNIPVEAVSNGIDLSHYSPGELPDALYKKFKIPRNVPIVSYIGRMDAEKHLWALMEAFARIQKGTGAHLLFVGAGNDVENLKGMAREFDISRHVTFTGRVTDDEKDQLHKVGTVYCMPSPVELQSIATLEAMASGQPIVAVDAGAVKELCQDGRNGFLCEKDNVDQISVGLEKLIIDKKMHDKYAAESLKIAKTHDINHTLDRFEEIYKEVIKNR